MIYFQNRETLRLFTAQHHKMIGGLYLLTVVCYRFRFSGWKQGRSSVTQRRDEAGKDAGGVLHHPLRRDVGKDTARGGRRLLHTSARDKEIRTY